MADYLAIAERALREYWARQGREQAFRKDERAHEPKTPATSCPTCGATAEELDLARRKLALDAALQACERHLATCRTCRGWGGPYCAEMETLRERHYQAWQAYYDIPEGEWDPWRS